MQKRRYNLSIEAYFALIARNKARGKTPMTAEQRREYHKLATRRSRAKHKAAHDAARAAYKATLASPPE